MCHKGDNASLLRMQIRISFLLAISVFYWRYFRGVHEHRSVSRMMAFFGKLFLVNRTQCYSCAILNSSCECLREYEINYVRYAFQLKMLTDEEEILIENRNSNFMNTFNENYFGLRLQSTRFGFIAPDESQSEMQELYLSTKFAFSTCYHKTITLNKF